MNKLFQTAFGAVKNNKVFFKRAFWIILALVYLMVFIKLFVINK